MITITRLYREKDHQQFLIGKRLKKYKCKIRGQLKTSASHGSTLYDSSSECALVLVLRVSISTLSHIKMFLSEGEKCQVSS